LLSRPTLFPYTTLFRSCASRRIMARSYATVGQMMSYAIDRSVVSPDVQMPRDRNRDVELLLRHMLEFVLMAARSRDAFLRTVARSEEHTSELQSRFDLV